MRRALSWLRTLLRELPIVVGAVLVGAVLLGGIGGIVGLVVGLHVHAPTAWFAVLEIGVPATMIGASLGLVVGGIAQWAAFRGPRRPPVDDDFAGTPPGW